MFETFVLQAPVNFPIFILKTALLKIPLFGWYFKKIGLPCIPVALNSGKIWPKNSFMKYNGDIHVSFLEPIMPGKDKTDFVKEIEHKIYSEIEKYS